MPGVVKNTPAHPFSIQKVLRDHHSHKITRIKHLEKKSSESMAANMTLPFPQPKFSSSYLPARETPPKPTHSTLRKHTKLPNPPFL